MQTLSTDMKASVTPRVLSFGDRRVLAQRMHEDVEDVVLLDERRDDENDDHDGYVGEPLAQLPEVPHDGHALGLTSFATGEV